MKMKRMIRLKIEEEEKKVRKIEDNLARIKKTEKDKQT